MVGLVNAQCGGMFILCFKARYRVALNVLHSFYLFPNRLDDCRGEMLSVAKSFVSESKLVYEKILDCNVTDLCCDDPCIDMKHISAIGYCRTRLILCWLVFKVSIFIQEASGKANKGSFCSNKWMHYLVHICQAPSLHLAGADLE